MADLVKFILILFLLILLIFLQGTRFLSFDGINPNLLFIFFSGLLLAPRFRDKVKINFLAVLLIFSLLIISFISGFWLMPWILLVALVILIYFFRNFFTGHPLPDFLLVLGLGTVIFYGLLGIFTGGVLAGGFVLAEIVYNLILGGIFWCALHILGKYARS